jgi:hypothetical protein
MCSALAPAIYGGDTRNISSLPIRVPIGQSTFFKRLTSSIRDGTPGRNRMAGGPESSALLLAACAFWTVFTEPCMSRRTYPPVLERATSRPGLVRQRCRGRLHRVHLRPALRLVLGRQRCRGPRDRALLQAVSSVISAPCRCRSPVVAAGAISRPVRRQRRSLRRCKRQIWRW